MIMLAGAVEVPINPALSPDERAYCFAVAEVRLVVAGAALARQMSGDGPAVLNIESIKQTALDPTAFPRVEGDAAARVVFTSGTTGRPKGAVHSQIGRWTANVLLRANLPFQPGADSNVLLMTPFSHGSSLMTHAYLSAGASVTLLDGVDPPTVLGILSRGAWRP